MFRTQYLHNNCLMESYIGVDPTSNTQFTKTQIIFLVALLFIKVFIQKSSARITWMRTHLHALCLIKPSKSVYNFSSLRLIIIANHWLYYYYELSLDLLIAFLRNGTVITNPYTDGLGCLFCSSDLRVSI